MHTILHYDEPVVYESFSVRICDENPCREGFVSVKAPILCLVMNLNIYNIEVMKVCKHFYFGLLF